MSITVRKLSTNDMLIFDGKNYESYVVNSNIAYKPTDDLVALAKDLVANGQGVHLNRAQLNQLQNATLGISILL